PIRSRAGSNGNPASSSILDPASGMTVNQRFLSQPVALRADRRAVRTQPAVPRRGRCATQKGVTYLGVLLFVFLMGLGLASIAHVWPTTVHREREQELLFV